MNLTPQLAFEYGLAFMTIFVTVFFGLLLLENRERMRERKPQPAAWPRVSIIIPAYNEEDAIAGTIDSCLASDYPDKEIIVVDDGSKDATLEIARKYEAKGVKVIRQANAGKGAALNNGIRHSTGKIIATLDSDSYMTPDALRRMVPLFNDPTVGAATSAIKVHSPRNTVERMQRLEYLITAFNRRLLSFINAINVTPGPLSLIRRSVIDEVGGFDEHTILEDQELAMRIQARHHKIESNIEAVAYTHVPTNLRDLTKQRVRWNRGGIRNILKHHYLVNPKYGDFGLVIMPLSILAIFALFFVLVTTFAFLFKPRDEMFRFGLDAIWFTFTPLHVYGILIFIGALAWAYIGVNSIDGEKLSPLDAIIFVLFYQPLITFFWLVTAVTEIKREKLRW